MILQTNALVWLLVLTTVMAGLAVFVLMRVAMAMRAARGGERREASERELMTFALQEALGRLRAQEREHQARADASERLGDQIITSLSSGLIVVSSEGLVQIVNPAGRQILGLTSDGAGMPYERWLGSAHPVTSAIVEGLETAAPVAHRAIEAPTRHSVGLPHRLDITVSPILSPARQLQGVICLFADVSTLLDLEEQLRLKDGLARLGELTAGLAHEFRNGLATIHGYARLINLETVPQSARQHVHAIREETTALGHVVSRFLQFARPVQLSTSRVDLRVVADRTADEIGPQARLHGGDLTVVGVFATVDGDELLLRQALSNLCRNSIEACASAGIHPRVEVAGAIDQAQAVGKISVRDNGPGFVPGAESRAFQPFYTTKKDGTGLGLALVQKIVIIHNGRVVAHNRAGGGADIEIQLPLISSRVSASRSNASFES